MFCQSWRLDLAKLCTSSHPIPQGTTPVACLFDIKTEAEGAAKLPDVTSQEQGKYGPCQTASEREEDGIESRRWSIMPIPTTLGLPAVFCGSCAAAKPQAARPG